MKKLALWIVVALLAVVAWTQRATLMSLKDLAGKKTQGMIPGQPPNDDGGASRQLATPPVAAVSRGPDAGVGADGSVYFLRETIHFTSPAGVRVIHAGTEVRKISEDLSTGIVMVDDGLGQFPVDFAKLTRDPRVAAALRGGASQPKPRLEKK